MKFRANKMWGDGTLPANTGASSSCFRVEDMAVPPLYRQKLRSTAGIQRMSSAADQYSTSREDLPSLAFRNLRLRETQSAVRHLHTLAPAMGNI